MIKRSNTTNMKKLALSAAIFLIYALASGSEVKIIITSLPDNTPPEDDIYIAGNFNEWDPGNPVYILDDNSLGQPEITLEGPGSIEFKFTRGSWNKVEGDENGGFLPNRTFSFGTADTLDIVILSWEDLGGGNSTAAENVVIMDDSFYIPQLDRYRRIWLYLPPDYETSGQDYPVLYMHDGQNLFDAETSFLGEWEVDETLNQLFQEGKEVPIVVGINNGGAHRMDEYSPWVNPDYGGGEGDQYAEFIVETLKPHIDENYRTRPGRENTGIMGSSLGGLISHYIGMKYQHVFSKAGIFSPAYWFNIEIFNFTYEAGKQENMRFYMMGGTDEGPNLVNEMNDMIDTLQASGYLENEITLKIVQDGQHNENLWRQEFGEAYEWLFLNNPSAIRSLPGGSLSPVRINGRNITLDQQRLEPGTYSVCISTIQGKEILKTTTHPGKVISMPDLDHGVYIITVRNRKFIATHKFFPFNH